MKDKGTGEVFAILDQSIVFVPFLENRSHTPLTARTSIRIPIAEEDRSEFQIGRKLMVSGTLSVSVRRGGNSSDFVWVTVNSEWIAKAVVRCDDAVVTLNLASIETEFVTDKTSQKTGTPKELPNARRSKK